LRVHDLTATPTLRTGFPRRPLRGARSAAIPADSAPLHPDILGHAGRHLGQRQLNLRLDVSSPPGAMTRTTAKSAAKKIAKDVGEGREDVVHAAKTTAETTPTWPLVTVAIVERALFGVGEDLIGLGRLFEARLGLLSPRFRSGWSSRASLR